MQVREKLIDKYPDILIEYDPKIPVKLGGLYERDLDYPNGLITLTDKLNYYFENSILAEEYGHHETTTGNILSFYGRQYNVDSARQELRARRYGHKLILPLEKLIDCYHHHSWGDIYAMCLHLEIDRSYFHKAIEDYKSQFGSFVRYRGYYIEFEPLKIKKT